MSKRNSVVLRLALNAVLAAVFFVLTMFSVEILGVKIVFSSLAVIIAAMLFGPVDAIIVGLLGAFLEQMMKYGFTATTLLWITPPAVRGLVIGLAVRFFPNKMSAKDIFENKKPFFYYAICMLAAVITSFANTAVYYVDSKLYHYYSYQLIFGVLGARIVTGIIVAIVTGTVALPIIQGLIKAHVVPGK